MLMLIAVVLLLVAGASVTAFVECEAGYRLESLSSGGNSKALILYHPSRDAHFTDDISLVIAEGLKATGYSVDQATLTSDTPNQPKGYGLLFVVSNTFFWTPDLPTLRYLRRARLDHIPTFGVIAGAGATDRSQRMLEQSLTASGAKVITVRAFWTAKPNDVNRPAGMNRNVALQLAKELGLAAGKGELSLSLPVGAP